MKEQKKHDYQVTERRSTIIMSAIRKEKEEVSRSSCLEVEQKQEVKMIMSANETEEEDEEEKEEEI